VVKPVVFHSSSWMVINPRTGLSQLFNLLYYLPVFSFLYRFLSAHPSLFSQHIPFWVFLYNSFWYFSLHYFFNRLLCLNVLKKFASSSKSIHSVSLLSHSAQKKF
jgi:hypothetical protein